ncbi:hypothetical protein Nepgr_028241 [Nepenthes gracilis]|uniref:Uncharacterized protein n=1 Tax=Nepenthes gracilis TaxID=150966 RepID=A0AAD3Y284_NEPGR|nr:hypothetical protein Nepgr_028241 [Nepenthes gracilis]
MSKEFHELQTTVPQHTSNWPVTELDGESVDELEGEPVAEQDGGHADLPVVELDGEPVVELDGGRANWPSAELDGESIAVAHISTACRTSSIYPPWNLYRYRKLSVWKNQARKHWRRVEPICHTSHLPSHPLTPP